MSIEAERNIDRKRAVAQLTRTELCELRARLLAAAQSWEDAYAPNDPDALLLREAEAMIGDLDAGWLRDGDERRTALCDAETRESNLRTANAVLKEDLAREREARIADATAGLCRFHKMMALEMALKQARKVIVCGVFGIPEDAVRAEVGKIDAALTDPASAFDAHDARVKAEARAAALREAEAACRARAAAIAKRNAILGIEREQTESATLHCADAIAALAGKGEG